MTEDRWEGSKEQAEYIKREHDAVLDVLIAADMWTGNPPYRGVSAAGQVKMILDALAAVTAERDAANRDKGYLSTAILQELPQELYLKVFDRYHKERGTYSSASPTYLPEPKDRNLAEAWAERDGDI